MLDKTETDQVTKRRKEDKISLPSCTTEGTNYCIECLTCRKEGRRRIYLGETSRSPYQRGTEHAKEVKEAVPSHPLVIHCLEEHGGTIQPILMRTLSAHLTPMDRQVQESLNIIQEMRKEGSCLNQKSEWAGTKIPDLEVRVPKGVARPKKEVEPDLEVQNRKERRKIKQRQEAARG